MYFMDLKLIAPLKRLNLIVETYPVWWKTKQYFKKVVRSTNQSTENSYKVAECIAKREKSFTLLYNAIFYRHANLYFDIN